MTTSQGLQIQTGETRDSVSTGITIFTFPQDQELTSLPQKTIMKHKNYVNSARLSMNAYPIQLQTNCLTEIGVSQQMNERRSSLIRILRDSWRKLSREGIIWISNFKIMVFSKVRDVCNATGILKCSTLILEGGQVFGPNVYLVRSKQNKRKRPITEDIQRVNLDSIVGEDLNLRSVPNARKDLKRITSQKEFRALAVGQAGVEDVLQTIQKNGKRRI